ncbi:MAG TPA: carbon-nitrogen hydrolase family protein, partial [Pseudomonas sp.]|nr:carbon-nitrogen hydrolase family protein [Pseudomonas sp.]
MLLLIIGGAGVYLYWAKQRPDVGIFLTDLRSQLSVNQGQPSERGNLLGIQPLLYASDYQSRETLHLKLAAYLQKARD